MLYSAFIGQQWIRLRGKESLIPMRLRKHPANHVSCVAG